MKRRSRSKFFIAVCAIPVFSVIAAAADPAPAAAPGVVVDVADVVAVVDNEQHRYTGQLVAPAKVNVVAQVSGEITEVGFADGDEIVAGQMLYRLSDTQYRAAAMSAEASLAEAKAKLEYAQTNFDRVNTLFAQNAASKDSMENAKSVLAGCQAAVLAAEAQLLSAEDNLSKTVITAPVAGTAGVTNFTLGNYVTPSSGTLVTLVATKPIRVRFAISTGDYLSMFGSLGKLKSDAVINLKLADGSICSDVGTVEFLDNQANSHTDSVIIYALFPNRDSRLIAGSTVTVTLSKKEGSTVPAIPLSAILLDKDGTSVYVVGENGQAAPRRIVTGGIVDGLQAVTSGLEPGETVVVSGTHKIMPGITVIPANAAQEK